MSSTCFIELVHFGSLRCFLCSLNNAGARCIFSFILPDVQHESLPIVPPLPPPPPPPSHSHLHYLPLGSVRGGPTRKMLLFLNESRSLSKTTLSGHGRQSAEVNALCQHWQASEPRAINSERERHFLLVNAILNYYYFIW